MSPTDEKNRKLDYSLSRWIFGGPLVSIKSRKSHVLKSEYRQVTVTDVDSDGIEILSPSSKTQRIQGKETEKALNAYYVGLRVESDKKSRKELNSSVKKPNKNNWLCNNCQEHSYRRSGKEACRQKNKDNNILNIIPEEVEKKPRDGGREDDENNSMDVKQPCEGLNVKKSNELLKENSDDSAQNGPMRRDEAGSAMKLIKPFDIDRSSIIRVRLPQSENFIQENPTQSVLKTLVHSMQDIPIAEPRGTDPLKEENNSSNPINRNEICIQNSSYQASQLDPKVSSPRGRLQSDEFWSQSDCEVLEYLMASYYDQKWLHIQAGFFNRTGRMVSAKVIQKKFYVDGASSVPASYPEIT